MQVYVLDYNIYLLNVSTNSITTVTTGGHKHGLSYGIPDWVYEGNNTVIGPPSLIVLSLILSPVCQEQNNKSEPQYIQLIICNSFPLVLISFHCFDVFSVSEEILGTNYALWWSSDGNKILYGSFDDTQVRDFRFPFYGSRFNQYTDIISIPYPKVRR